MKLFWKITRYARAGRFWLYVLLALAAWVGFGEARAQVGPTTTASPWETACSAGEGCDQAEALQACTIHGNAYKQAQYGANAGALQCTDTPTATPKRYTCKFTYIPNGSLLNCTLSAHSYYTSCPAGTTPNAETGMCDDPNPCPGKPPLTNVAFDDPVSNGTVCMGGCLYVADGAGQTTVMRRFNVGTPQQKTFMNVMVPGGEQCSTGEATPITALDPNKTICQTIPGKSHNECIKPNGDHCITTAKGNTFCSPATDVGPRSTADGTEGVDHQLQGTPNQPPPNMRDPVVDATTTTTINNTTTTTNIYTGSGSNGGQGYVGSGGEDTSQGDDGQVGDGQGEQDEDGDGDGEAGEPGSGVSDLYDGEGKTVGDVVGEFKTRMESAPIVTGTSSFLTTNVGGACPVFSVPATDYWQELVFNYHCQGPLADAIGYGSWLILAIAAWAAFKWAFL